MYNRVNILNLQELHIITVQVFYDIIYIKQIIVMPDIIHFYKESAYLFLLTCTVTACGIASLHASIYIFIFQLSYKCVALRFKSLQ